MLFPAVKTSDEEYATADDILNNDDLPECDIRVPQWATKKAPNGMLLRVRGLDLDTEIEIDQEATDRVTGVIDAARQLVLTFQAVVIKPKLNKKQIDALHKKSAYPISEVANFGRSMGRVEGGAIERYVIEAANLKPASSDVDTSGDAPQAGDVAPTE